MKPCVQVGPARGANAPSADSHHPLVSTSNQSGASARCAGLHGGAHGARSLQDRLTHLDLFSGIGGFALAARWAGIRTIGFSEIDPFACRVLAKNFPDTPNYGDIKQLSGVRADIITGGFPCQPFSHAGKRKGAADDRALWPEMLRVIKDARPAWVVAENVPGLIGMGLETVVSDLEAAGYGVACLLIPACGVGAPHRRRRIWIVAESLDTDAHGVGWNREEMHQLCEVLRTERGDEQSGDVGSLVSGKVWESFAGGVFRVADGLPDRVDRLRAVGNSVVPQIAFVLLDAIAALEFGGAVADARGGSAGERVSGKAELSRAQSANGGADRPDSALPVVSEGGGK